MTDYQNGKIYVIKSNETENVYIGSTCSTLKQRFCSHKADYKRKLKGGVFRSSNSYNILKYADAYIELIENFPCESRKELLDREGEIIKNTLNCVNTQIQGRTMAQYRIDNAEKIKQQCKEYREKNKDLLKNKYSDWYKSDKGKEYREKQKVKRNVTVLCPICNIEVSKSNLTRHQKTIKCKKEYYGNDEEKVEAYILKMDEDNKERKERRKQKYDENKDEINRKRRERRNK